MAINQLSTANTFQEWLSTTSLLVATANALTDNVNGGFVANSSIFIEGANSSLNVRTLANINTLRANTGNIGNISMMSGSIVGNGTITMKDANVWGNIVSVNTTGGLWVGGDTLIYGNLRITGNTTLDSIGFNDLSVSGNANIAQSLVVVGNTIGSNLTLSGNIAVANITQNLSVGGDAFIYGNLTISGNVSLDSFGFDDLDIRGSANVANTLNVGMSANIATSLWVGGNTTIGQNLAVGNIVMTGALVGPTRMTGSANDAIYGAITAAIDSSIAFSIALG